MRIVFARHGESEANLTRTFSNRDPWHPLTEAGRGQARALAELVSGLGVGAVVCSPAVRAVETAGIVAARLGVSVTVAEALREFDVGEWEGSTAVEGWAEWSSIVEAWRAGNHGARVSNGESLKEIVGRLGGWLNSAVEQPAATTILAVGHGGVFGSALPQLLQHFDPAVAAANPLGHCDLVVTESVRDGLRCVAWGPVELG